MMIKKIILLPLLTILILYNKPVYSVEYGLFFEDNVLIERDNKTVIEENEIQLSMKNWSYGFKKDILENSAYNQKNIIIIDNKAQKAEEFFEFVGMFISNYESSSNVKIKVKFTQDAELDKGSIVWRITF